MVLIGGTGTGKDASSRPRSYRGSPSMASVCASTHRVISPMRWNRGRRQVVPSFGVLAVAHGPAISMSWVICHSVSPAGTAASFCSKLLRAHQRDDHHQPDLRVSAQCLGDAARRPRCSIVSPITATSSTGNEIPLFRHSMVTAQSRIKAREQRASGGSQLRSLHHEDQPAALKSVSYACAASPTPTQ